MLEQKYALCISKTKRYVCILFYLLGDLILLASPAGRSRQSNLDDEDELEEMT